MRPKRPIALPKISMIRIFTNKEGFAASEIAAPDPTIPTQNPHTRFTNPTVIPDPKITCEPK